MHTYTSNLYTVVYLLKYITTKYVLFFELYEL